MAGLPHLVQMHKEFADKGLVIINISLDSDKNAFKKMVKDKGMDWPQIMDGKGWNAGLYVGHGFNGIPQKFLLDRDGVVRSDRENLMDEDGMRAAIKKALKSPRKGGAELAAADKLMEKKDYAAALKAYVKLAESDKDGDPGKKAAAMVKKIKSDPVITRAMATADADKNAPKLMKMGRQFEDMGKTEQARKYYQQVLDKYPGTKYADQAREAIDKL